MKITKIAIRNYLGIQQLLADKLGKFNVITGGNGVGKSTLVKAITEAIKSSGVDPELIHTGKDKAEILIEIDGTIEVARTITPTANTVKVVNAGAPVNKPQTFLKSLIGPYNLNPVEFFLATPKAQRELLLSSIPFQVQAKDITDITGLDLPVDIMAFDYTQHGLTLLEEIQEDVFERRAEEGRTTTRLTKALEQDKLEIPPTFNRDEYADFDLETAVGELGAAQQLVADNRRRDDQLNDMRRRSIQINDEIEAAQKALAGLHSKKANLVADGNKLRDQVEAFIAPDTSKLEKMIAGYKEAQRLTLKLEAIAGRETQLEVSVICRKGLDGFYKMLGGDVPRALLARMDLPVDDLEIKGDNILVAGRRIDKLSTSEQIKFATSIARALAGELKILCVDRFESLEPAAREAFEAECAGDEFEYFVTIVTGGELSMEAAK